MKRVTITILFVVISFLPKWLYSQVITTNGNPVGLEHNLLFNATRRYIVTETGQGQVDLNMLFDGNFSPSYSVSGTSYANPTVITIDGLPGYHTQRGAWVGWSTRYWPAYRFKIEGYEVYSTNNWITITDYSNTDYNGADFSCYVPGGAYTKLRFTFYLGTGPENRIGISELFFIHPEATTPYSGLLEIVGSTWNKNGNDVNYMQGKVGIGIAVPQNPLDVKGTIHAQEVKVDMNNWSDFVFHPSYQLKPLTEVEKFIKTNGHLHDIPSAAEVEQNGVNVGEMQKKLLQKVEELTLYVIEKDKEIAEQKKIIVEQNLKLEDQKKVLMEQQLNMDKHEIILIELKKQIEILKQSNI